MRVAIAYNFHDRDWFGGRYYFASLIRAVAAARAEDIELVLVVGHRTETSLPQEFPNLPVLRTHLMDRMHPTWLMRQATLRSTDRDPLFAWYLRSNDIDILSHSGYLGPRSGLLTLPWLYDFQFLHLPQYWSLKHVRWAERRYRASCTQGDGVIVSSHDALADLERFAPGSAVQKHVLQFVSNPIDFGKLPSQEVLRARYSLPAGYFYLPNQFWKSKNHRLAIDALAVLRRRGVDATIACTGQTVDGRQPAYFRDLMAYLVSSGVADRFRILGVVPRVDTQGLMAHASAVINPSRFEGWSTTVEEAKTLGVRLLLSEIAVHREQCGTKAHYFSSDDPDQLANRMQACIDEDEPRMSRIEIEASYERRLRVFGQAYVDIVRRSLAGRSGSHRHCSR